jgi:hypothetical protein
MEIDEARQNELARSVECLDAAGGRDFWFDRSYPGIADTDVAFAAQALAGIDHLSAANDEVVGIGRPKWLGSRLCLLDRLDRRNGSTSGEQE